MQSSLNLALDSDLMLHAGNNITSLETGYKLYLASGRYASLVRRWPPAERGASRDLATTQAWGAAQVGTAQGWFCV